MRAPRFPPPLSGRVRERGGDEALSMMPACRFRKRGSPGLLDHGYQIEAVRVSYPSPCPSPTRGGGNVVALLCPTEDGKPARSLPMVARRDRRSPRVQLDRTV